MALLTVKVNGNVVFSTDNSSGSTTVDITNYVQFGNNTLEIDVGSGACPAPWLFGCVSKPGNLTCLYPSGVLNPNDIYYGFPPHLGFTNLCDLYCANCQIAGIPNLFGCPSSLYCIAQGSSSCPSGESCAPPLLPPGTYTVTFTIPQQLNLSYATYIQSFQNVKLTIYWNAYSNGLAVYITGSFELIPQYGYNCEAIKLGIYPVNILPLYNVVWISSYSNAGWEIINMNNLYSYVASNNSWYICVPMFDLASYAQPTVNQPNCGNVIVNWSSGGLPCFSGFQPYTAPSFLIAKLYVDGRYIGQVNMNSSVTYAEAIPGATPVVLESFSPYQGFQWTSSSQAPPYFTEKICINLNYSADITQLLTSSVSGGCHTLTAEFYYYDMDGTLKSAGTTNYSFIKMYDGTIKPFNIGPGISGTASWQYGCPETSVVVNAIKNSITVKSTLPTSITLNGTGSVNGYYCSDCNLIPEFTVPQTPYLGCGYIYPQQPAGCYGGVPMTSNSYSNFVAQFAGYYFLCASNLTMQMCNDSSSPGSIVIGGTTLQPGQCANLSTSNVYYGYFPYGVNIYVPEGNPGGTYKLIFQYVGSLPQVTDGYIVGALNNQVLWSQTVTITVSGPPPPSGCNVAVNVASSPGSIPVSASPTSTSISQGQSATIQFSAPSTYSIGGYGYQFQYWIINGQTYTQTNPSITVTCQQAGQTITINATAYYQLVSTPTTSPTTSPTVSPTVSPTSPTYAPPPTTSPTVSPTVPTVSPTVSPTTPTLVVSPTPPPPTVTTKELSMLGLALAVGALIGLGAYVATSRKRRT